MASMNAVSTGSMPRVCVETCAGCGACTLAMLPLLAVFYKNAGGWKRRVVVGIAILAAVLFYTRV